MVLFWSARLLILRKSSPMHVYSILHVYWYWFVCMNLHHAKSNLKYVLDKYLVIKYKKLSFEGVGWDQVSKNGLIQSLTLFSRNFSPCTFIDFPESFPPVRLFCPARLMFFKNFPTCTFILSCTSIRYTRVFYKKIPPQNFIQWTLSRTQWDIILHL